MTDDRPPIIKDLVLIGGGHSHVEVIRRFGMNGLPGMRLTVICREIYTPYSGMLPGLVAGHYRFDEAHIDLGPLCRFASARFYHDEAVGLDLTKRLVLCRDRPPVPYDVLSINIGSTPDMAAVPGAANNGVAVKPISRFIARWEALCVRVLAAPGPVRIGVVGTGAGGVEMVLAMQYRLRVLLAAAGRTDDHLTYSLFGRADHVLPSHPASVQRRFARMLHERGIRVITGQPVVAAEQGHLRRADGTCHDLDEMLFVTNARAAPWLRDSGLALDPEGFVAVGAALQSTSHPNVFAAGDIAAVIGHERPKSGVFAVRQGPPLAANLRRAIVGETLQDFHPQRDALALISTGDAYAVASRGRRSVEGRSIWRWKDWIDRRFMRKYNELPTMPTAAPTAYAAGLGDEAALREISAMAMRCGGCGAKVGGTVLSDTLARLRVVEHADILIGLGAPDDAAVVAVPRGKVMIHTVDYFRSFIDDPFVFGKVAANHALGDIFAMGGDPQSALAIATVPYGLEAKVADQLFQMMSGAIAVLNEAGCPLVGGHTSEGAELGLGFAVNGLADPNGLMRKGGMRPGDRLILTKPLGTGTLFAADMRIKARGHWIETALRSMVQSNRAGAACLRRHKATSCTDVTGFGLLGHLIEMTKPSAVDVTLDLAALPLLDGAIETVRMGIFSSLQPQNIRLRRAIRDLETVRIDERFPLLFDPQTAGGLLASVPGDRADACLGELRDAGYGGAAIIGTVRAQGDALEPVSLVC